MSVVQSAVGSGPTKVYLFPGQGSDERLFSKITLDSNYQLIPIVYPIPARGADMKDFAKTISTQIDTSGKYVFIGVSLGGMLCVELNDYFKQIP